MSTAKDVAKWMAERVESQGVLYQEDAASQIMHHFGHEFVYRNANDNLAINRQVLREFRKLTEESVVWDRRDKHWHGRTSYDTPGKRQTE